MKYIILLAACFLGTQTFAQKLKLDMDKLKKYLDQSKARQGFSPTKPKKELSQLFNNKSIFDTAQFSHNITQGDVFILPQDNMPCLKPKENDLAYNMPYSIPQPFANNIKAAAQIPNAYQGRQLILVLPKSVNSPSTGK